MFFDNIASIPLFIGSVIYFVFFIAVRLYHTGYWSKKREQSNKKILFSDGSKDVILTVFLTFFVIGIYVEYFRIPWGLFHFSMTARLIAILFGYFSVFYLDSIHTHLADNWTFSVTKLSNQRLITTGPYKLTRHPMYTCFAIFLMSSFINFGNIALLLSFGLIILIALYRVPMEDRYLREMFGVEHEKWSQNTAALIPYVF